MRPGAVKIGCTINSKEVVATAVQNPDKSIALVIFNPSEKEYTLDIQLFNIKNSISINAKALQTILIQP